MSIEILCSKKLLFKVSNKITKLHIIATGDRIMSDNNLLKVYKQIMIDRFPDVVFEYSTSGVLAKFAINDAVSSLNLSSMADLYSNMSIKNAINRFIMALESTISIEKLANVSLSDLTGKIYLEYRPYTDHSISAIRESSKASNISILQPTKVNNILMLWCIANDLSVIAIDENRFNIEAIEKAYLKNLELRTFRLDEIIPNTLGTIIVGEYLVELCNNDKARPSFLYALNKYYPIPSEYLIIFIARNVILLSEFKQDQDRASGFAKIDATFREAVKQTNRLLVKGIINAERDILINGKGGVMDEFDNQKDININIYSVYGNVNSNYK